MQSIRSIGSGFLAVFAMLTLWGCAGTPGSQDIPDWVLSPPQADEQFEYFVVSAESPQGSYAEAEEAAGLNLISQIDRVLGVDISLVSDAEVRGTLEEYEAEVRQSVRQVGSGTINGLRIVDRFLQQREQGVILYVLASYERSALEAEKEKRQALIAEREDAVSLPESQGVAAESSSSLYVAFTRYVQAAVAASSADIRNAQVKMTRNLDNALRVLGEMRIVGVSGPDSALLGNQFDDVFRAQVLTSDGMPIPEALVTASYRQTLGGRSRQVLQNLTSGTDGLVFISPGSPAALGTQYLTMTLDISSQVESLRSAGLASTSQFAAIQNLSSDIRTRFEFDVTSEASSVPTAVVLIQSDIAGLTIDGSGLQDGVLQALSEYGFVIVDVSAEAGEQLSSSAQDLRDWVRATYGSRIDRIVYGNAAIVEVDERDGFIVKVQGEISVYDFSQDQVIFRTSGVKNSRGTNSARAVTSAFFNLGRDFGDAMVNSLP